MPSRSVITLLTDFGWRDPFVGVMKGVIAGIAPQARVIDLSHSIEPQNFRQAGLWWRQAAPFFPARSIHVGVVDPEVGGQRGILAVRGRRAIFLAPDNGMIGLAMEPEDVQEAFWVRNRRYFLPQLSRTFHGRDVFAPVAAWLSRGLPLARLGPPATDYQRLTFPMPRLERLPASTRRPGGKSRWIGEIIEIDHFGNCITNIALADPRAVIRLQTGRLRLSGLETHYAAVAPGKPLALIGSSGWIEIAINQERADRRYGLRIGQKVVVEEE